MSKSPVLQDLEEVDIKSELIKHTDNDDSPITLLEKDKKNAEDIDENEQELSVENKDEDGEEDGEEDADGEEDGEEDGDGDEEEEDSDQSEYEPENMQKLVLILIIFIV